MDQISCLKHKKLNYKWLHLSTDRVKIFCDYCVDQSFDEDKDSNLAQLVHINKLLDQPELLLKKLNLQYSSQVFSNRILKDNSQLINEKIKDLEQQINNIQEWIQQIQKDLKSLISNIQKLRENLIEDVLKNLNFEELKNILLSLNQKESKIIDSNEDNTQPSINIITQNQFDQEKLETIEKQLHTYFSNLRKDNFTTFQNKLRNKVIELQGTIEKEFIKTQNLEKIQLNVQQIYFDQLNMSQLIFPNLIDEQIIQTNLINYIFKERLIQKINQGYNKLIREIKPLYVGSKDGLNSQTFWQKVNGKSNLLIIFKSKSNQVFGGYSPCQWSQNTQNYVVDNYCQSFLFSQNHNEIYPIKSDKIGSAIYCYSSYGPTFGSGYDIYIASDFQSGSSNLGNTYYWDKYQNSQSTHLFGSQTPNLSDCEIFEIIFMK